MNCFYCDRIRAVDPAYVRSEAEFDLGSAAPRCPRHWRYLCAKCSKPNHFMASAYCTQTQRFFCRECAGGVEERVERYWAWEYYFAYQSPWSGQWEVSLDRLEFEGRHPLQRNLTTQAMRSFISSRELYLVRYPIRLQQWRPAREPGDEQIRAMWDRNAQRWDARYEEDGDATRRYQNDEPLLALLGEVCGLRVLDAGSGNGYLSRKLAKAGAAAVVGVELSEALTQIAMQHERAQPLGIAYHCASLEKMPILADASFDKVVSNFVLMDVRNLGGAVREIVRVLRPGGVCVAAIVHPCFACGPEGWYAPAADSPRPEDRFAYQVDWYFDRGARLGAWGGLDPLPSFHRPLSDYWRAYQEAGLRVEAFEEPQLTERGRRELPPSQAMASSRIPCSCIFRLVKPPAAW